MLYRAEQSKDLDATKYNYLGFLFFLPQKVKQNMQLPVTGLYASPTLVRTLSKISLVSVLKGPRFVFSVADMDAVNATFGLSVCGKEYFYKEM